MILLLAMTEAFLLLGWVWRSNCLCSPTTFYKNCWIRQFPGLTLDLEPSQKRGAHILKVYSAASAQQCSQTCCLLKNEILRTVGWIQTKFPTRGMKISHASSLPLHPTDPYETLFLRDTPRGSAVGTGRSCQLSLDSTHVSCNLAVFSSETNNQSLACLHAYCPALESCILKPGTSVVLYNITPGIDPDLLVFEKLSFKEPNTRSFSKWERQGSARAADSEKCQDASMSSRCLPATASSSTMVQDLVASSSHTLENNSIRKTASTTHFGSTSPPPKEHFTEVMDVISGTMGSTSNSDNASMLPTPTLTSIKTLSHMPSPAHLNSSKQHLNDTKGYSGRNYTSDNEGQRPVWEGVERSTWLLPIVLCSSLVLICCCTILLAARCRRKRRGRYKPRRRGASGPRQFIRYTMVNDSL